MQRQFTSGSRQAPDPYDQFLEENNFYRKHTARDSSCLFRVISEQMYDTQMHHLIIRKKCVRYMRKHFGFFQPLVDRDLNEYLDDMSKPKTYGTLIELQAVSFVFHRNILLFQPFDLGNYYVSGANFTEMFRVFYSPERHFDSVFTCDYIKDAAICQSICYEILYKDLYKLPDVSFAVEQMLHPSSFDNVECLSDCNEDGYCTGIQLTDGRTFEFDLPANTACILENHKLCHFHYPHFPRLSEDLQRDIKTYKSQGSGQDPNVLNKTAESLLPNKFLSCVRQLLQEGITPFPYKVAKALDANMYRNIEFDSWNETRKELKLQNWYRGDANFKVGAKCHVKLCKAENISMLCTCHIQEISADKEYCIVFVEQLGEKRMVPYDSLSPLPPEQFRPWSLPYRLQRHMQKYSSYRYSRNYNCHFNWNSQLPQNDYYSLKSGFYGVGNGSDDGKHARSSQYRNSWDYRLKQYTHLENFRAQTLEYCACPLTVDHGNNAARDNDAKMQRSAENLSRAPSRASVLTADGQVKQEMDDTAPDNAMTPLQNYEVENAPPFMQEQPCFYPVHHPYGACAEEYYNYAYEGNVTLMPANVSAGTIYYANYPNGPPHGNLYVPAPHVHMQQPPPLVPTADPNTAPAGSTAAGYLPNNGYYSAGLLPPPSLVAAPTSALLNTPSSSHNLNPFTTRLGQAASHSSVAGSVVNREAKRSAEPNGTDLPTDIATLRYFYNLGLDYYNKSLDNRCRKYHTRVPVVADGNTAEDAANDIDNVAKISSEMQNIKLDENGNVHETKADGCNTNTNSTANPNQNSGSGKYTQPSYPRRFSSRYFNSKERQSYPPRNNGGGGGGFVAGGHYSRSQYPSRQHQQHELNQSSAGGRIATSATAAPSTRNQVVNSTASTSSTNSIRTVTEQGIQTSPLLATYTGKNQNNNAEHTQTLPTLYNPNFNPFVTSGAYEYAADAQNGQQLPPHFAPGPLPGSVLIPLSMAPSGYSIFPPPAPHGLNMHPTSSGAYGPYVGGLQATAVGGPGAMPLASPLQAPPPPPPLLPTHTAMMLPPKPQVSPNGFYAAGVRPPSAAECAADNSGVPITTADACAPIQYQCMSFPPPMPVYYSPSNVRSTINAAPMAPPAQQLNSMISAAGELVAGPPPTSAGQQTTNGSTVTTGAGCANAPTAPNNPAQPTTTPGNNSNST